MLAPTFGAYDLAVTLLFPFVAIRLIAAEKESGALKLALQLPFSAGEMVAAKLLALAAGWLIAWLPGLIAVAMWRSYGRHLYAPATLDLWRRPSGRARNIEPAAGTLATNVIGRRRGGCRSGVGRERGERGDCDSGLHARNMGARFYRGRARRMAGRARVVHADRGAAFFRAG